jgi:hypothetical protein
VPILAPAHPLGGGVPVLSFPFLILSEEPINIPWTKHNAMTPVLIKSKKCINLVKISMIAIYTKCLSNPTDV